MSVVIILPIQKVLTFGVDELDKRRCVFVIVEDIVSSEKQLSTERGQKYQICLEQVHISLCIGYRFVDGCISLAFCCKKSKVLAFLSHLFF